ncbi:MAG: hypothetical protein ATN34_02770 [Epulopiscium sp. Nele67-Bin002]|nr:MAG: hypothetical protein ATN34_02770 [Epulopiscium sp. Nele67-Bin002]
MDFTVNKLIVLYLLSEIKLPLTLSQLTQIILEKGYTDYFSIQQYLNQLFESQLIEKHKENNSSYFCISDSGKQTLDFFVSRIPCSIRSEIDDFIYANWRSLKNELDITAQYIPNKKYEYIVYCKITENDISLIELNINVTTKHQAAQLCDKWKNNASDLYRDILHLMAL